MALSVQKENGRNEEDQRSVRIWAPVAGMGSNQCDE